MRVRCLLGLLFIPVFLLMPGTVFAAKTRVRKPAAKPAAKVAGLSYSSAKISRPSNSVILNLTNLGSVKRISYELSYTAHGIAKGAMGSIAVSGQASDSRDLYFGTCSKGVCTPDYGIANASLFVTVETSAGTSTKRYRIRW